MISAEEQLVLAISLEGFLYGIYSGVFAIYLHCSLTRKESKTTTMTVVFYALCILFVLSTVTVISDLLLGTIDINNGSVSMVYRIERVQVTINGSCDFISQCTLVYRCWIMWGKNIWVVILPLLLAITYLATWLAASGASIIGNGEILSFPWGLELVLTASIASMVVNAMVTGLIVFRILAMLGPLGSESTGGSKLRHITFIIIESGVALFAIQLVRVVITTLVELDDTRSEGFTSPSLSFALNIVIAIHEMLNGIAPTIILVRVSMRLSFDDDKSFKEAVGSLNFNHPQSDSDSLEGMGSSSNSMPPQEDIYFDNPPSDSNSIILDVRRVPVGSSTGSTSAQEKSKDSILATTSTMIS